MVAGSSSRPSVQGRPARFACAKSHWLRPASPALAVMRSGFEPRAGEGAVVDAGLRRTGRGIEVDAVCAMDAVAVNGASRVNDRGPDECTSLVEGEAVENYSESRVAHRLPGSEGDVAGSLAADGDERAPGGVGHDRCEGRLGVQGRRDRDHPCAGDGIASRAGGGLDAAHSGARLVSCVPFT